MAFFVLLVAGCATVPRSPEPAPCQAGLALVNASLWYQSSAEYRANAYQAYNMATRLLEESLAARSSTSKPSAVILDLDETALDNSAFETRMIRKGITYDSNDWLTWVKEAAAEAIPGAVEFLEDARRRGVTPFYITNRKAQEEAGTRENLRRLGFPLLTEDNLLTRGERAEWESSDKGPRRDWVAARYDVLLLLGDDLNDFVPAHDASREDRERLVRENEANWGTRWVILPNPIYGSWERAVTAGSSDRCEELNKKLESLRP